MRHWTYYRIRDLDYKAKFLIIQSPLQNDTPFFICTKYFQYKGRLKGQKH